MLFYFGIAKVHQNYSDYSWFLIFLQLFPQQLAKKGQHAIRDTQIRSGMHKSIVEYEQLEAMLRDENAQQDELDCLNYLAGKQIIELFKAVPTETDVISSCSYKKLGNSRLNRDSKF